MSKIYWEDLLVTFLKGKSWAKLNKEAGKTIRTLNTASCTEFSDEGGLTEKSKVC